MKKMQLIAAIACCFAVSLPANAAVTSNVANGMSYCTATGDTIAASVHNKKKIIGFKVGTPTAAKFYRLRTGLVIGGAVIFETNSPSAGAFMPMEYPNVSAPDGLYFETDDAGSFKAQIIYEK